MQVRTALTMAEHGVVPEDIPRFCPKPTSADRNSAADGALEMEEPLAA